VVRRGSDDRARSRCALAQRRNYRSQQLGVKPGLTRIATLPVHTSIEGAAALAGADRERQALRVGFVPLGTQ
jgi:hypothetical protein